MTDGYTLERRAKIGYREKPDIIEWYYPEIKGFFYKLSVLPTRDIGYHINEIIETEYGKYEKVI